MKSDIFRSCALIFCALTCVALAAADDSSALRPPKGAKVAVVVFEDLQCPRCASTAHLVEQAARTYHIPVIRHDFPLRQHNWSFEAAVRGRDFDTILKKISNDFRD